MFLFMLTNGPFNERIMNYLVYSFAAVRNKALKLASEVRVLTLIALNSILLISWRLSAADDGCHQPVEKTVHIGSELQPLLMLKILCGPPFYCESWFSVTSPSRLHLEKCGNEPNVMKLKVCSEGQKTTTNTNCTMLNSLVKLFFNYGKKKLCDSNVLYQHGQLCEIFLEYTIILVHVWRFKYAWETLLWAFPYLYLCVTLVQQYFVLFERFHIF